MYQNWYKNFKLIELCPQLNLVCSYITLVLQNILYPVNFVPVVMVDCGLARLNLYHFIYFCHTWMQEIITISFYNCTYWSCGTIGKLVFVMRSATLLHVLFILLIMLFIFFFKLWIIFLSVIETLVIDSSGW